jgi:drug/metabolite transporter (DMT)-like permease
MQLSDMLRLLGSAAVWGSSFIFMRVIAPVLGPIATTEFRVLIAGGSMSLYFLIIRFNPEWKKNWRHYMAVGALNGAIPFALYAFAALHIPASYSVLINSTAPLFGAVFSSFWLAERLTLRKISAILIAGCGVALVARVGPAEVDPLFLVSICACLGAAACYGLSAVYMKRYAGGTKPLGMTGGSMLMAGLMLLPLLPFAPTRGTVTPLVIANLLGLSLLCSGLAFIWYYRLMENVGPTKALTVAFLMPVFGMTWAAIFLGEPITPGMAAGACLILSGTYLVVKKERTPKKMLAAI